MQLWMPFLLAVAEPVQRLGERLGTALIGLLLLGALVQSVRLLGERGVCRPAAGGLALVLFGWSMMMSVGLLGGERRLLVLVVGAPAMAAILAGMVFCGSGLLQLARRGAPPERGRLHGWTGLLLGGLLLIAFSYGVVGTLATDREPSVNAESGSLESAESTGSDGSTGAVASPEAVRFPPLRFEYRPPGSPWARIEPVSAVNEDAALGYVRSRPRSFFVVIAENAGEQAIGRDSEALSGFVKANLESGVSELELVRQEPRRVGDLDGIWLVSRGKISGKRVHYVHWVQSREGFAYQLMLTEEGGRRPLEALEEDARLVFAGFRALAAEEPTGRAPELPQALAGMHDPRWGFAADLDGLGCRSWAERATSFPDSLDGALFDDDAGFVVVPFLAEEDRVPLEILGRALAETVDVPFDRGLRVDTDPAAAENELELRTQDEQWRYRLRILRGERTAFAIAAWTREGEKGSSAPLGELLRRFELVPTREPLTAAGLTPEERTTQARLRGRLGRAAADSGDWGTSELHYRRAVALAPDAAPPLEGLLQALNRQERYREALDTLAPRLSSFPSALSLRSWEPYLLSRVGEKEAAVRAYESVFSSGHVSVPDLRDRVDLLESMDRVEPALAALRDYRERHPGTETLALEAGVLRRAGRPEEAIALLGDTARKTALDPALSLELAEGYLAADQAPSALATADELASRGHDTPESLLLRGRALLALQRAGEAKSTFEQVLRRDPASQAARRLLAVAATELGQGENYELGEEVPAVEVPPEVLAAATAPATPAGAAGAIYQLRLTAISFVAGEEHRRTELRRVQILDATGAAAFASLQFELDPQLEQAYVNRLRVLGGDGAVRAEGKIDDYYLLDDTSDGVASRSKTLVLPVRGVAPGTIVEVAVTWRRHHAPQAMPYLRRFLAASYPAPRVALWVRGDLEGVNARGLGTGPPANLGGGHLWLAEDAPVAIPEPFGDRLERYVPTVVLADAKDSWSSVAKRYLDDIAPRLASAPSVEALASELRGEASGDELVVRAARAVQTRLVYHAEAFGERAWMPDPVAEVVARRHGDCKAHALLLWHLLRQLGVTAHLALASFGDEVVPEVPSLSQFDHMVVYVPGDRGGQFLDPTDKAYDLAHLPPLALAGGWALVLDEAAPRLERIGEVGEKEARVVSRRQVEVTVDGAVSVAETLTLTGPSAAFWRHALTGQSRDEQLRFVQSSLGDGAASARIGEASFSGLDDPLVPLVARLTYTVPGRFERDGDRLVGRLPAVVEHHLMDLQAVPNRKTPFRFWSPVIVASSVAVIAPAGWRLGAPPETTVQDGGPIAWRLEARRREDGLELDGELRRGAGRFTAGEYASLELRMDQALAAFEPRVEIVRGDAGR